MPAFLLTAWPLIKRFGPYAAVALALLGLYLWIDHHGYARAQAKYQSVIASDEAAMRNGIVAIKTMQGAMNAQNAAVEKFKADGAERAREAAAASAAALKANASLVKTQATLAEAAKRHYSSAEPCSTPAEVMGSKI